MGANNFSANEKGVTIPVRCAEMRSLAGRLFRISLARPALRRTYWRYYAVFLASARPRPPPPSRRRRPERGAGEKKMAVRCFATLLLCLVAGIGLAAAPAASMQKTDGGNTLSKATTTKAAAPKTESPKSGHKVDRAVIKDVVRDLVDGLGQGQRRTASAGDKSVAERLYVASTWYMSGED